MQTIGTRLYGKTAELLFYIALVERLITLYFGLSPACVTAFYIIYFAAVLLTAVNVCKTKRYTSAFMNRGKPHMNTSAVVCAVGFFADFVYRFVKSFALLKNGGAVNYAELLPECFACVFSVLSVVYFSVLSISFGSNAYDFKKLKILHFAPILWAASLIVSVMREAVSSIYDADEVIRYILIALSACFFYCFAYEASGVANDNTYPVSVFFARVYRQTALIYVADRVMLVLLKQCKLYDESGIFALESLLICFFVFAFEKNALSGGTINNEK